MPAPRALLAGLTALAVAPLAACGNSEAEVNRHPYLGTATASAAAGGVQQIVLVTGDDYRFHPSTFVVHPGPVRVVLRNTGQGAPHEFQVTGLPGSFVPLTLAGETRQDRFVVPNSPGRYQFVCAIHLKQGQVGTMIVRAGG